MNPVTHLLASWAAAETSSLAGRDRAAVAWAGLAPDLDGLGALPDIGARLLGLPDPALYGRFHHVLLHGLPGALALAAVAALLAKERLKTFVWALAAVHLHLACDLVGSRGPSPDDLWPIPYLAPLSGRWTLVWQSQWPLDAWPNILVTLLLLAFVFARAVRAGRSPVALFSPAGNRAFVATVRSRWLAVRPGRTPRPHAS